MIEPAPPPLEKIADQLRSDWISAKAAERAKLVAEGIAARVARGTPLNEAARASGALLPPPQPIGGRRLQLAQFQGRVPPPLIALFSLPQGKSRLVSSPQNRAFFIVQVKKVTAGNASMQPALIARTQAEFGEMAQREYAEQLVNAIQAGLKIKLNKQEMARVRQQLSGG